MRVSCVRDHDVSRVVSSSCRGREGGASSPACGPRWIQTDRRHRSMCASAAKAPAVVDAARLRPIPATCGRRSRRRSIKDHTVVVPDLRGMGLSSHPAAGYDKKTQAVDIAARHGQARRSRPPTSSRTTSATWSAMPSPRSILSASRDWCVMDAPLPGIGPWDEILQEPAAMALQFPRAGYRPAREGARAHLSRPLLERAVGQSEGDRRGDAACTTRKLYARPGAMHAGIRAVRHVQHRMQLDNKDFSAKGKLHDADAGDRRGEIVRRSRRRW